jgi:hypothetical protein
VASRRILCTVAYRRKQNEKMHSVEIHYDYCLEGRHCRASLYEIKNIVNEKLHIIAFNLKERVVAITLKIVS